MWPTDRLQTQLKIEHPVIQAPMGAVTSPELTAAISNAGGFGMVAGINATPERLIDLIRATKRLTARPIGVNLVMKDAVSPLVDAALGEGVAAVSFFWGDPAPYVRRVHDARALVMHTVSSAEEASRSIAQGTDILVAQGWEAGGHVPGSVASMVLIPAIVDVAGAVPVVAAGGIADGRAVVAALALGASGVWMGTRFLSAQEARLHPIYREGLFAASEADTIHSSLFNKGWVCAHRTLRNSTVDAWINAGRPAPGARPGEHDVVAQRPDGGGIERYSSSSPHDQLTGEVEALSMWAGQGVYRIGRTLPAVVVFDNVLSETRDALAKMRR